MIVLHEVSISPVEVERWVEVPYLFMQLFLCETGTVELFVPFPVFITVIVGAMAGFSLCFSESLKVFHGVINFSLHQEDDSLYEIPEPQQGLVVLVYLARVMLGSADMMVCRIEVFNVDFSLTNLYQGRDQVLIRRGLCKDRMR